MKDTAFHETQGVSFLAINASAACVCVCVSPHLDVVDKEWRGHPLCRRLDPGVAADLLERDALAGVHSEHPGRWESGSGEKGSGSGEQEECK